ncbi:MAG: AAA family ATPase [Thermoleophilaceae bacterium]|nr:AAA family ATPase [Thermoleophilaceae bacterium]
MPTSASLIDASSIRLQGGADYYLQQIINDHLDPKERVELARAYRSLREEFSGKETISQINTKLEESADDVSEKKFSLAIDVSSKTAWESSLIPHLDDLPIQFVGKGDQNTLKILLALNRRIEATHVVLIEEPENHLSPGSLNALVRKIAEKCVGKQIFVTTHSSYVLNKLGLEQLVLLNGGASAVRIGSLAHDTQKYFKKLSGYDTLRIVLARRAILVEGPSDELVIQRAYRDVHGKLPLEDGIDVINVRGLSHKRFLDIAMPLGKTVAVVTDCDGDSITDVELRFARYTKSPGITVHVGAPSDGETLEPQIVTSASRAVVNEVLGKNYSDDDALIKHMKANKTEVALKIFESQDAITLPAYIQDAVA